MSKHEVIPDEQFESKFQEQFKLLSMALDLYEAGHEEQYLSVSAHIRTIVHDSGRNSVSLLHQIRQKDKMKFLSAPGINVKNLLPSECLVSLRIVAQNGLPQGNRVPLDYEFLSMVGQWVDFDSWWLAGIVKSKSGEIWTRKDLLLIASNQKGGAHIEATKSRDIALDGGEAFGWSIGHDEGTFLIEDGALIASIITIGRELRASLMNLLAVKPNIFKQPSL